MQQQTAVYIAKKPDENGLIHYTDDENGVWKTLYQRQIKVIENRACQHYIDGIKKLELCEDHIPQCAEVSRILQQHTGWSVEPVEALISFKEFFQLLANKKFPAASFIRRRDEIDYLKEPDIFHELFGHCPMLTHQAFADFTHAIGKLGVIADRPQRAMLARLYWFTVEFGLIQTEQGLRIYGGGILSSKMETGYSLESDIPQRQPFNLETVLRTAYRYDELQKNYFIIENIEFLYHLIDQDLMAAFNKAISLDLFDDSQPDDKRSC